MTGCSITPNINHQSPPTSMMHHCHGLLFQILLLPLLVVMIVVLVPNIVQIKQGIRRRQQSERQQQQQQHRRQMTIVDPKTIEWKLSSPQQQHGEAILQSKMQEQFIPQEGARQPQQEEHKQQAHQQFPENHETISSSITTLPSFVQLCQIISSKEGINSDNNHRHTMSILESSTLIRIVESPEVCKSQDSYHSLGTILLSSMIAQLHPHIVQYEHQCSFESNAQTPGGIGLNHHNPLRSATIQQFLPPIVLQQSHSQDILWKETTTTDNIKSFVTNFCAQCSHHHPRQKQHHSHSSCWIYPKVGHPFEDIPINKNIYNQDDKEESQDHTTMTIMSMIATWIFAMSPDIETAIQNVRLAEGSNAPPIHSGVLIYVGPEQESSVLENDQNHHDNNKEQQQLQQIVDQIPMIHYAEILPPDIAQITILHPESCTQCHDISQFLQRYLRQLHPLADMSIDAVSGSAITMTRLMEAPFIVCSTSVACILPAMFRGYSYHPSHLLPHQILYPWLPTLFGQQVVTKGRPKNSRTTKNYDSLLGTYIFLRTDLQAKPIPSDKPWQDMIPYWMQPPSSHSKMCLRLRGRLGRWEQDMTYAKTAQYITNLGRFQGGFEPTPAMPYRLATTYRWVDDLCPVHTLQMNSFCDTMQSLHLTRIYFVGDSLAMQMAQSLWKLLGNVDEPFFANETVSQYKFHWNRTVECSADYVIEIVHTRNDMIDNNDEMDLPSRTSESDFNCAKTEFCMPWLRHYDTYKGAGGTLLVANAGPHVHDFETYRKLVVEFFQFIDLYHTNPNDIVVFRTTPPGHPHCEEPTELAPLTSYEEYLTKYFVANEFSYHLFPLYNRIAEQEARKRHKDNIQVLDVVPMTVLRPDGHVSSPQKCRFCTDHDCLHYILPGPPDWWNHLLYSNLMNLVQVREHKQATVP
jgi:GDSL/SGNH-like Acyl-Esterase family found in Pmr5 and Cas1p